MSRRASELATATARLPAPIAIPGQVFDSLEVVVVILRDGHHARRPRIPALILS